MNYTVQERQYQRIMKDCQLRKKYYRTKWLELDLQENVVREKLRESLSKRGKNYDARTEQLRLAKIARTKVDQ